MLKPTIYDPSALLANASLAWSLTCFKIMISIENVHFSLKAEVSEQSQDDPYNLGVPSDFSELDFLWSGPSVQVPVEDPLSI